MRRSYLPEDAQTIYLDVEEEDCRSCGEYLYVSEHRDRYVQRRAECTTSSDNNSASLMPGYHVVLVRWWISTGVSGGNRTDLVEVGSDT
jgi:hypothetical protein